MKETLFKTPWLSVAKKNGYIYVEEPKCPGGVVAVLPYRWIGEPNGEDEDVEFLVSMEQRPCHSDDRLPYSITGGIDVDESPAHAAVRELHEEAGLLVGEEDLEPLGTVWPYKASACVTHLFAVDVTGLPGSGEDTVRGEGDGSAGEAKNYCRWAKDEELVRMDDPLLHAAFLRLEFF